MHPSSTPHIGYVDGASFSTRNLASVTCTIFSPLHSLVQFNDVCIAPATNNKDEYDVAIVLLADSLDHNILHLHVCIDSF